jgi:very-short-patch-repair endonuclease
VDQKNALQVLLQIYVGIIQVEKRFEWLKTPDPDNLPPEYKPIAKALKKYRNHSGFLKRYYSLLCDIVVEDKKLILEYDENQHFSRARLISLQHYPSDIKLGYSLQEWITYCEIINAKDNYPADRDEKRAFYDTVRDIEAQKSGYKLIRVKHGEVDWESLEAVESLRKLLKGIRFKK